MTPYQQVHTDRNHADSPNLIPSCFHFFSLNYLLTLRVTGSQIIGDPVHPLVVQCPASLSIVEFGGTSTCILGGISEDLPLMTAGTIIQAISAAENHGRSQHKFSIR